MAWRSEANVPPAAGLLLLWPALLQPAPANCSLRVAPLERAECYAREKQWKQAEELLREFLRAHPGSPRATVLHAEALVRLGHGFDAILALERLLKIQPDDPPALKLYAFLSESVEKNVSRAEDLLERVVELAPSDADAWRALGTHYLERMRASEAIRCFEQAVRLDSANALYAAGFAYSLGQAGKAVEAEDAFSRALRLAEGARQPDPRVYVLYGDYLADSQKCREAGGAYSRALALDPGEASVYYKRAVCFDRLEEYEQAERDALSAIRAGGDQKPFYMVLMRVYGNLGDQEKARKAAQVVERLGEQEEAERSRGRILRESLREAEPLLGQGRFAEAAPHYERITRAVPTFHEAWFALGVCYSQTGRRAEAERAFREYLALQPLSADGHAALGVLLLEGSRTKPARAELEEAVELDPSAIEPRKALALIHIRAGNPAAAAEVLRPLSAMPDADAESLLMLADLLLQAGARSEALAAVERVLQADPGNSQAQRLKQAISR
jgi:Flp pilus assembly protein TadD